MLQTLKQSFSTLALAAMLMVPMLAIATPANAQVETNDALCRGLNATTGDSDNTDCGTEDAGSNVENIVFTIIDVVSFVVGAISVIMIIVGGLRYITSSGESNNVQAAKNTIMYAIVGLIIVIFAQTIVKFVISRVTDAGT